jgi:hypothetical protein
MMKKLYSTLLLSLLVFACNDDDNTFSIKPSLGFESTFTFLQETNSTGVKIGVASNASLSESVEVRIAITEVGNVEYGVDFTTEPEPVNNEIVLTIDPETEQPGFFVYPTVGTVTTRQVIFEITSVSGGGLNKAQPLALVHTLSINKRQLDANQLTIAQARALYTGSAQTLSVSKFIEGVVTSTNDNVTAKNVFIQDETGGIVLRFNANNTTDPNKLLPGERVRLPLSGVTLTAFNGLIQLGDGTATLPHSKIVKLGTEPLPPPVTITLAQLNSNQFQSQRVKIVGLTITTADGTKTLSGNNTISDGSVTSTLRVESYAPFASTIAPQSIVTITGIASTFISAQLVPMSASDIVQQ